MELWTPHKMAELRPRHSNEGVPDPRSPLNISAHTEISIPLDVEKVWVTSTSRSCFTLHLNMETHLESSCIVYETSASPGSFFTNLHHLSLYIISLYIIKKIHSIMRFVLNNLKTCLYMRVGKKYSAGTRMCKWVEFVSM